MADMKKKTYPTTNGNLAFDLDVLVRERELETAGEHNRRQEEVRRAEAQPKPRTRPQARPRQRVSPVLLAGPMVLAALAVVLVMGYVQLTTISGSVSEMKNELTQLNTEHVALLTRYEQTYDLASVKEAAEAAGMSKPSSGQITYIDLGSPDSATVYRSGADGFFSKIADTVDGWLQAAVEYFR